MTAAKLPAISETEFMQQVTDLADLFQWQWVHFRPAQTSRGWRTPVSGTLGQGWPDLVLVRSAGPARPGRLIFAELKRDGARTTPDQDRVLAALGAAGAETYCWRPADLDEIAAVLR